MPRLSKIGAAALAAFGWTGLSSVSASYLVISGGAGGGSRRGSGGGASQVLTGTASLNPTLSYTVTVGAGGAGGASGSANNGSAGTSSTISSFTSSLGAGGGSDGGAAGASGSGKTGGTSGGAPNYGGGGGGGDTANGSNGTTTAGGAGGAGTASSISGSSVTYAGGGGGGTYDGGTAGAGGSGGGGGGGSGANPATAGTAGTANTGSGGGGGGHYSGSGGGAAGGQGGSGVVIISYPAPQKFGGGVVTTSGSNVIHTFNTSGTLSPLSSLTASYLIVAGGGGGGAGNGGGGGGAGGLLSGSGLTLDSNSIYTITVGSGGSGGGTSGNGVNGTNSSFSMVTTSAVGGGYGGGSANAGASGGSGGGGSGSASGGSATSGQGFAGGNAVSNSGGGGGGAGAVGATAAGSGGNGGVGVSSSISGSATFYAGGGGGASGSSGGNGGGGAPSTNGTANTGGGGGGYNGTGTSGNGGSGVVIISYAGSTQQMAGGTVTISGGNVIHTFTSSGYLTPIKYVNNSLRFRNSVSANLTRTPSVASNRTTFTISTWVKRGLLGTGYYTMFGAGSSGSAYSGIWFNADTLVAFSYPGSTAYNLTTTQVFRDPAAWYHLVFAFDTTQATSSNRIKIYVNGVQVTSFSSSTYPSQNYADYYDSVTTHYIGYSQGGVNYFDGYMAEVNFIDGQQLTPNSFGTFNSYGVWQPITYGGSYGTNGFYLPFTPQTSVSASYLLSGGGGGGGYGGGGGGAGGLITGTATLSPSSSYAVTIGGGGTGSTSSGVGGNIGSLGGASTFNSLSAGGGGAGGSSNGGTYNVNITPGSAGNATNGSGAGGAYTSSSAGGGGSGTGGSGGAGNGSSSGSGGGSGGNGSTGGAGGAGTSSSITGSAVTYSAGGSSSGSGAGSANTGNGGGGGGSGANNGGNGGSGVLVISYSGTQRFLGGTVTSSGGNTIHTFTTSGTLIGNISADYSPNGNNWTPNNISLTAGSTYDSMTDVPTLTSATAANYAVLNPLDQRSLIALSNANLHVQADSSGSWGQVRSTIAIPTTGKWYWEFVFNTGTNSFSVIGIGNSTTSLSLDYAPSSWANVYQFMGNGTLYSNNSSSSYGSALSSGDILMIAFDRDNSAIYFGKNGTWFNSSNPATQTSPAASSISTSLTFFPMCGSVNASGGDINFGQRPFTYTPPTGFVALNTYNL